MSVLIDVREVPWRILELVKARILANRARKDQRAKKEEVRGLTRPRPQRKATGATMSTYRRPEPVGLVPDDDTLSLGWVDAAINGFAIPSTSEKTARLISGNGTAYATITSPAYPNPTVPPSAVITWSEPPVEWSYFGAFAPFGAGTFWAKTRSASVVDVTMEHGWGNNRIVERMVLPHSSGFIFAVSDRANQRFGWHTYRITDTSVTIFVKGGPGDDPDVQNSNPGNRYLFLEATNTLPTVISGPNEVSFLQDSIQAFNVTGRSVRAIAAPGGLRPRLTSVYGDLSDVTYADDFTYFPGQDPVQVRYRVLKSVTVDGTFYPNVWLRQIVGNGSEPGISNWWPTVSLPEYPNLYQGVDENAGNYFTSSTTGLAFINIDPGSETGSHLSFREAGTPFTYRALLGEFTAPVPGPFGRPLADVLASLAPLPPKFSIIQARSVGLPDYVGEATSQRFLTFRPTLDNFPEGARWESFAGEGAPSIRGNPSAYRVSLAPLADRQPVGEGGVTPLHATTFGSDAYCRQSLLTLGFSPADLTP